MAGIQRGFGVGKAIAFFMAFALVDGGGDIDPVATSTNADTATFAAVLAGSLLGILGRNQVDILRGRQ